MPRRWKVAASILVALVAYGLVLTIRAFWPRRRRRALPRRAWISIMCGSYSSVQRPLAGASIGAQFERPDIRQSSRLAFLRRALTRK